jgi:hypothetical protein
MESLLVNRSGIDSAALFSGGYRVAVTEVSARLTLVSGAEMPVSFFLESGRDIFEHEGLLAHLNNERKQFIVVRCEAGITLVCADAIAYVSIGGRTPEFEFCEVVGTPHLAARIRLCTGEELGGDFVSLAEPERSRLSDLLNQPGQRFLLFTSGCATYLIHRNAVQQVNPL